MIPYGFSRRHALFSAAAATLAFAANLVSCVYFIDAPESRALVVGLDAYASPYVNDLKYCVADAEAMGEAFAESGVETVELKAINGTTPTYVYKSDVLGALAAAAEEAPAGGWDSFFFYYAGHGYEPNGTLAMSDATSAASTGTAITVAELLDAVDAVHARVRTIILDSCYSGNFVAEEPAVSLFPDDYTGSSIYSYPFSFTLLEKAAKAFSSGSDGSLLVLSAAGADEPSQEEQIFLHGIFTAGLLESAQKGDKNRDGLVTLSEACDYAAEFIRTQWNTNFQETSEAVYLPRLSGNALDVVLFK